MIEKIKDKKYIKVILQSILVFLLFYYGRYFQVIPILLFDIDLENISATTSIYLSLFSNIVVLIILFLLYRKELQTEWKRFMKKPLFYLDISFRYWFLGLVVMACSNMILSFLLHAGGATNEKMVQGMITTLPLLMLFNAGIIAPIIEELTFRKAFRNILKKKWIFIFTSGFIFGALHVITSFSTPLELLYIIPYSSLGIAFAYIYSKTDTIFAPISMHMMHNLALILLSILAR